MISLFLFQTIIKGYVMSKKSDFRMLLAARVESNPELNELLVEYDKMFNIKPIIHMDKSLKRMVLGSTLVDHHIHRRNNKPISAEWKLKKLKDKDCYVVKDKLYSWETEEDVSYSICSKPKGRDCYISRTVKIVK